MTEKYAMFIHKLWHTQVDQIEWFGGQTRDSRLWSSTSHLLETLPTLPSKINRPQNNPTSTLNGKMSHLNGTKNWKIGRSSPIASIFGVGWSFSKIPPDIISWFSMQFRCDLYQPLEMFQTISSLQRGPHPSCRVFPGLTRCAAELWEAWVMTGENGSRHPKVTGQALFDLFWLVTCRYCIGRYSQYSLSDFQNFQFAIVLLNKGINCESGGGVGPWQKLFLWLLAICLSPKGTRRISGNLSRSQHLLVLIDFHAPVHKVQEGILHLHLPARFNWNGGAHATVSVSCASQRIASWFGVSYTKMSTGFGKNEFGSKRIKRATRDNKWLQAATSEYKRIQADGLRLRCTSVFAEHRIASLSNKWRKTLQGVLFSLHLNLAQWIWKVLRHQAFSHNSCQLAFCTWMWQFNFARAHQLSKVQPICDP